MLFERRKSPQALMMSGMVPAVFVAVLAQLVVPRVVAMYSGLALPAITRWVISMYPWFVLLPVLVLVVYLLWPAREQRGRVAAAIGGGGSTILVLLTLWALWQPMVHIGVPP